MRPRIIPARAGFTGNKFLKHTGSADHPRSRGVYPSITVWFGWTVGSSPLARGLRAPQPRRRAQARIIPARAGFTSRQGRYDLQLPDHPRSRGVYMPMFMSESKMDGSSPLARGLPTGQAMRLALRGIIPARAGFTQAPDTISWTLADHPRSRGVYLQAGQARITGEGSSPLARGLLGEVGGGDSGLGIIPARAGFTIFQHPTDIPAGDHPRSRGVYSLHSQCSTTQGGSSPLARGLRVTSRNDYLEGRIIPARAGFT